MKSFRDIRVIPVVLIAIFGLAVLKVAGLVIDGGYVFDYQPDSTKRSWAQESFNFPTGRADPADITGSVHEKPKEEAAKPAVTAPEVAKRDGAVVQPEQSQPVSPSERAILERLQARRQELEARAREIDIRESLLKAAEKRIESRVEELKAIESRITAATEQKNEAEAARFKSIVIMNEGLKPKDAAKGFEWRDGLPLGLGRKPAQGRGRSGALGAGGPRLRPAWRCQAWRCPAPAGRIRSTARPRSPRPAATLGWSPSSPRMSGRK